MKRLLRERVQPASAATITRKRKSRGSEAAACTQKAEESLISDLDELLLREAEAAAWWTEDDGGERLPDSSLADLLQHLAACDEDAPVPDEAPSAAGRQGAPRGAGGSSNKNALAARLNRLRKKEYVRGLEGEVARLSEDNQRLERERRGLGERVRRLEEETRYLRAVLANDSALSQLLGRLTDLGGVRLATTQKEEPREHDYALPAVEEQREPSGGGGVCLHVDQGRVSVEFCPTCARSAARL